MGDCKKFKKESEVRVLNEPSQSNLEEANTIQIELEALSKRMNQKIMSVVEEFVDLKKPLYSKRHTILRAIPHFWPIAFTNHPKLKLLISAEIEDCFNYLQYMQVIENTNVKTGYQIVFGFAINPYFYNNKLVKSYVFENNKIVAKTEVINWKENMNLNSTQRKTVVNKKTAFLENFFDWLQNSNVDSDIISDIIHDDLWVDPLKYFFMLDEPNDDNSESDSDEDDIADDFLDSKDEDEDSVDQKHQ